MKVVDRADPRDKQTIQKIVECPGEIFRSLVATERIYIDWRTCGIQEVPNLLR